MSFKCDKFCRSPFHGHCIRCESKEEEEESNMCVFHCTFDHHDHCSLFCSNLKFHQHKDEDREEIFCEEHCIRFAHNHCIIFGCKEIKVTYSHCELHKIN